ncbi:Ig-like domain-containing protein [Treponema sp.]|uniref:Ig-like domain-containing protein n=1 Tax=Treponema sp. TaxID=166 RepID=UPI00388DBD39
MLYIRAFIRLKSILLTVLAFSSCSNFFIPYFEVIDSSYDKEKIEIVFSSDIDDEKTRKAFLLTENGLSVSGTFSTSNKILCFYPQKGIQDNCEYEISIGTMAEDINGKSLKEKFYRTFNTKEETMNPKIMKIEPKINQDDSLVALEIIFSEPIQEESFQNAFKIEPQISFIVDFMEDDTKAHMIPTHKIPKGIMYKITISEDLKDKRNNPLEEPYEYRFKTGNDNAPPEYEVFYLNSANNEITLNEQPYENHNVPPKAKVLLKFNEEINMEYIGSRIEIFPSTTKFSYESTSSINNMLTIYIDGNYGDYVYLTLDKGIEDLYGNKTEFEKKITMILDDENCRPVSFIKAYLQIDADNNYKELSYGTQYTYLNLDPLYFGNDKIARNATLYLVFKISKGAKHLDYFSSLDALSFKTTNSCCSISIKNAQIISTEQFTYHPLSLMDDLDGTICAMKFRLEITNTNRSGLVEMNINRNVMDSLGNKLEKDISIAFNK